MALSSHARQRPGRRERERTGSEVTVRFICARPQHLQSTATGDDASLVAHHGTFGYCAGRAGGPHEWIDTHGAPLGELVTRSNAPGEAPTKR